jgi:hypothetical protein
MEADSVLSLCNYDRFSGALQEYVMGGSVNRIDSFPDGTRKAYSPTENWLPDCFVCGGSTCPEDDLTMKFSEENTQHKLTCHDSCIKHFLLTDIEECQVVSEVL